MTGRASRLSVTDHGDRELLARVRAGDVVARDVLLSRHRTAVARVGDPEATAREVVHADDTLPFRVVWLCLTATGTVPETLLEEVRAPWRTAVWHHLVEGDPLEEVALAAGTSTERVIEQLREAYDALGPDLPAYRRRVAALALGPHATGYLSDRPEPAPLARRSLRDPALVVVAAFVAVSLVAALYVVPMGGRWSDGHLDATVRLPGTLLAPVAAASPPSPPRGDDGRQQPSRGEDRNPPPAGASGPPPAPAPEVPQPPGPPAPTEPPSSPPPKPPTPGTTVPLPAGLGQVQVTPEQVHAQVVPPVGEPVEVTVPLPGLPEGAVTLG